MVLIVPVTGKDRVNSVSGLLLPAQKSVCCGVVHCIHRTEPELRLFGRNAAHDAPHPLRRITLFSSLNGRELAVVQALRHERHYLAGEIVFDEGDDGEAIYAIVSGEVEILRAEGERQQRLALLGAGEVFGELALLDQAPRAAQARANRDCQLVVFFRADFMSLLETHPKIASKIALSLARHLGSRLRQANAGKRLDGHL